MKEMSAERRSQNSLLKRPALKRRKPQKVPVLLPCRASGGWRSIYLKKNKGLFLYGAGHCRDVVLDEERIKYDQGQGADHRACHQ